MCHFVRYLLFLASCNGFDTLQVAFSMDIDSIHDSSSPFPAAIFKTVKGLSKSVKPYLSNVRGLYFNV